MKKYIPLLIIPCLLLGACSNKKNTSSGSSEAISTSESDSSSTSEQIVSDGVFEYVLYAASKYNKTLTASSLEEKAGIGPQESTRLGDLFRLLKAAFEGYMPAITGQRKYGGDFTSHRILGTKTQAEQDAFDFLARYGLIATNASMSSKADKEMAKKYLQRFHAYFGTSEKDDFAATINNEWLFNDPKDQNITANDIYRTSHVVDGIKMYDNAVALIEEASDTAEYSSLKNILYYYNDNAYTISDNPDALDFVNAVLAATSPSDILDCEAELYAETGFCSYLNRNTEDFLTAGDTFYAAFNLTEDKLFQELFKNHKGNYQKFRNSESISKLFTTYRSDLSLFGFDNTSIDNYIDTFASIFSDVADYFIEEDIEYGKNYLGLSEAEDVWSEVTNEQFAYYDIFHDEALKPEVTYIIDYDYYALEYLGSLFMSDANLPLLKSYSLINYVHKYANFYHSMENGLSQKNLVKYAGYLVTDYYLTTEAYDQNKETAIQLFDELITSLKSNAVTNGWLSNDGVSALTSKADKVTHSMFAEYEGQDFDYDDYFSKNVPTDLYDIYNYYNLGLNKLHNDWLSKGSQGQLSKGVIVTLYMEPFTANAFYVSFTNSITITMGYLFSVGNINSLSIEELLATFGLVMGHEITHGFDSSGCYYDGDGHRVNSSIFPEDDLTKFKAKQQDVINLYNYEVLPGIMQSGKTTLSEDLADIGGLGLISTIAKGHSELSYEEFFRQIAFHFMSKTTRASYDKDLKNDVHAYGAARLNPLLMSSAKFIQTFDIQPDDGMYRDPASEIVIW